jgi:hypothetical protein
MRNRLTWPPLRTNVMAVICVGVVVFCRFGLSGSGIEIGGRFVDPRDEDGGVG